MTANTNWKIRCVNCGKLEATERKTYSTPDPYEQTVGISADGYWRSWVSCMHCGLFRSEYSRDSEIIHTIYESDYRASNTTWRKQSVEDLFLKIINIPKEESETAFRLDWLRSSLKILEQSGLCKLSENPSMIDIGGASGVFAYAMKEQGFEASVVDPSSDGSFIEKYGISYQKGYFGQDDTQYNLLSFLYVLEHVNDPSELLELSKSRLKPNGILFFELPDASAFHIVEEDHDAFNACHLWLFGASHITSLLQKHGFSVLALQRYRTVRGYPSLMVIAGHTAEIDA